MLIDLIKRNRSYRRFDESKRIDREELVELIDLARLSPSAANRQPLKYYLSYSDDNNNLIFSTLSWAGYLKEWGGPIPGERPSAYIVLLGDMDIAENFEIDAGLAAQSILLAANEKGMGGCILGSVSREELRDFFNIPSHYKILFVIALGFPIETVQIEEVKDDGNIQYWRDEKLIHHVPKRKLTDLIIS